MGHEKVKLAAKPVLLNSDWTNWTLEGYMQGALPLGHWLSIVMIIIKYINNLIKKIICI